MIAFRRMTFVTFIMAVAHLTSNSSADSGERSLTQNGGRPNCHPSPSGWQRQGCEFGELATVNLLEIRDNQLFWNGKLTSDETVFDYLEDNAQLDPRPGIAFVVDLASDRDRVAAIRRAVGERYRCSTLIPCVEYTAEEWEKAGPPPSREVR